MSRRSSTGSRSTRGRAGVGGRSLHVDATAGMAGNMFLGALLDAGLPRKALESELAGLGLEFSLKVGRVERGGFAARHVDVTIPGQRQRRAKGGSAKRRKPGSGHAAAATTDADSHAHAHAHAHDEQHLSSDGHGRTWKEIERLLSRAKLAPVVRDRALGIFEGLARAEAAVHGRRLDEVHFHEVGMVDAIVDVTAAAAGLELLGVGRVTCSPVGIGHGFVDTAHGRLPIPTPATLELLKGIPTAALDVAWETVTPTGAAILRWIVDAFVTWPGGVVERVGVGAGRDRPGPVPNVVRVTLGPDAPGVSSDRITVIETNLDDLVPEHFDHLLDRLMHAGAVDVGVQHMQMKKNRPGFLLRVLCPPPARDAVARTLFAESTAIGLRHQEWDRLVLERRGRKVDTEWGRLRVKQIRGPDGRLSFSAEYDDCARAAKKSGEPLRDVVRRVESAAREAFGEGDES